MNEEVYKKSGIPLRAHRHQDSFTPSPQHHQRNYFTHFVFNFSTIPTSFIILFIFSFVSLLKKRKNDYVGCYRAGKVWIILKGGLLRFVLESISRVVNLGKTVEKAVG